MEKPIGTATIMGESHIAPLSELVRRNLSDIKKLGYTAIGLEVDEPILRELIRTAHDKAKFKRTAELSLGHINLTKSPEEFIENFRHFILEVPKQLKLVPLDTAVKFCATDPAASMPVRNNAMANAVEKQMLNGEQVLAIVGLKHTGVADPRKQVETAGIDRLLRSRGYYVASIDAPIEWMAEALAKQYKTPEMLSDIERLKQENTADVQSTAKNNRGFINELRSVTPYTERHPDGFVKRIDSSGVIRWYNASGKISSPGDAPAIQYPDGTSEWMQDGKLSRDNAPARIVTKSNYAALEWYTDGKLQRPAAEGPTKLLFQQPDIGLTMDGW